MTERERFDRLLKIAEQDACYMVWKNSFDDAVQEFDTYIRQCPNKKRNFLGAYAEGGRMMMQRLVNLACSNMQFPDENNGGNQ